MAKKNKILDVSFNGFKGIDTQKCHSGNESIYDIANFHICDDGSLEKRCGYRRIYNAAYTVRTVWSGKISEVSSIYILDGPYVNIMDMTTQEYRTIGSIKTTAGDAQFFYYGDNLYLSDRTDIYIVTSASVMPIVGYVPLYGKEWNTTYVGEVNEPLNLLNRYARITYRAGEVHTNTLATKYPVDEIISVYRNGVLLNQDEYTYSSHFLGITIPDINEGDYFEVNLRYDIDIPHQLLHRSPFANIFGGAHNNRLFMWGEESHKNLIFASRYVSPKEVSAVERDFPGTGAIYFPEDCDFTVGDYRNTIKAMVRHYDRLLIFGENETWMASDSSCDTDAIPILKISTSVGCPVNHGALIGINNPISIGDRDILEWTSDTDELSECNYFSISEEISEKLSPDFLKGSIIFKDKYKNEIWVHKQSSGEAWIYNLKQKSWVRFTNIYATEFFDVDGQIGFIRDNIFIYIFDDNVYEDRFSGFTRNEIVGTIQTGILDFDSNNEKKLYSIEFDGDLDGGVANVTLTSDRDEIIDVSFLGEKDEHLKSRKRLFSGRLSFLKNLTLSAPGSERQRIHRVKIYARRNDK